LLDEFEHLLGAALVVDELLASCRGLRALVTSRERLRLQAEWLLPLAGLPVPPEDVVDGAEALAYAAARLLSDRARQVAPGFRLDGDDLPPRRRALSLPRRPAARRRAGRRLTAHPRASGAAGGVDGRRRHRRERRPRRPDPPPQPGRGVRALLAAAERRGTRGVPAPGGVPRRL